jgi:glycosyltransferase involved in cell wall biosynthesis
MKRVLLISYYFPPLGGSGVFRPLRLSKYLPRNGWEVTVLTVSDRVRALKDRSIVGDVRPGVRVERAPSLEPRTPLMALNKLGMGRLVTRLEPWFMVPDDQRGWVSAAVRRASRVLRREPHQVVISTAAPYSAHLIGLALARKSGIRWVADFRDEWTTNPYLRDRYPTTWHRRLNERLEREVLEGADRVVCVSRPWLDSIHGVAPHVPEDRFRVMPNGYDGEHFPVEPAPPPNIFRVAYTGMFYGHRSPMNFLEAVRICLESGRIAPDDLEIVLMGHAGPVGGFRDELNRAASGRVRIVPHRPYREALELLSEAAVLLLVIPREGGVGNHTGKLFPYLASGRPILALAPEPNVAADVIRESHSGVIVPPDDPGAIASGLLELYHDWKSGAPPSGQRREVVLRYEASRQAEDWAEMLDDLIRDRARPQVACSVRE